jgi:hypothetical protein
MTRWFLVVTCAFGALFIDRGQAAPAPLKDVKVAFNKSATDRELAEQDAELTIDDQARKVTVKNKEHPLDVAFDGVQKVVFDTSTHMRGGKLGLGFGLAGAAISAHHVTDSWCYLEYRGPDGTVNSYMLIVPTDESAALLTRMQALFGDKVVSADFAEKPVEIERDTLKDLKSKHDITIDKSNHPTPESKPDKALVVVVCPKIPSSQSTQIKLHANDQVVLVNRTGTYGFLHLDPGEYQLVSQSGNASAIRMTLEAGKEYYFLQETFMGSTKSNTQLTRHSKELVMFQLNASFHSDWKRQAGEKP